MKRKPVFRSYRTKAYRRSLDALDDAFYAEREKQRAEAAAKEVEAKPKEQDQHKEKP